MENKFTDKDIEQLKQRDNIPLDWEKVKLEEANQEDQHGTDFRKHLL